MLEINEHNEIYLFMICDMAFFGIRLLILRTHVSAAKVRAVVNLNLHAREIAK